MARRFLVVLCALGAGFTGVHVPATAQDNPQGDARREMQAGNILRIRDIERRVLPTMRDAEYLGFAYDPAALAYRLKFIRDGRVLLVDVDARSGRILRRTR